LPIAPEFHVVRLMPLALLALTPSSLLAMLENHSSCMPIALPLPYPNGSTGPCTLPLPPLPHVSPRPVLDSCPPPPSPYRRCKVSLPLFPARNRAHKPPLFLISFKNWLVAILTRLSRKLALSIPKSGFPTFPPPGRGVGPRNPLVQFLTDRGVLRGSPRPGQ
jgi:hypothetical protein